MAPTVQLRSDARDDVLALVRELPKVELHVHVEGTLEAELMLRLARRNGVSTRFRDVADVRRALMFDSLQSFLDLYYEQTQVLQTRQDFFDLTAAYLHRVHRDRVRHTEVFFDPQSHTSRGIPFDVVVDGISAALTEVGRDLGISSRLIMCFLRHRSEAEAFDMLERARAHRDTIHGVGLDSAEVGNPPSKFSRVFAAARRHGFWTVAHAGEEGPPDYVWQALALGVRRIDHGVRCMEDEALVERLVEDGTPLTVCPVSNVRLKVVPDLAHHNLRRMLERGLAATVNSDDPAYFGGYLGDVFAETVQALGLGRAEVVQLAENAVRAAVLDAGRRQELLTEVCRGSSVPRPAGQSS
jgi:adenosine deaminase